MASRLALSLLFLSGLAVGQPLAGDSPEVQTIMNLIADANKFIEDSRLTEFHLLNIGGYLPTDIVKLTDGKMGEFNTNELKGTPIIHKIEQGDGSTEYVFDVRVGLREIFMNYTFHVNMAGLFERVGMVTLTPANNAFKYEGAVRVAKDGTCSASLMRMSIDQFGELKLTISPDDIPGLSKVSQVILNLVSSSILPSIDLAVGGVVYSTVFQQRFSEIVCKRISGL